MAKRLGKRRRDRAKAAEAVRKGIVQGNLSSPKPAQSAMLVRSKSGAIGVIRGPAMSSDARDSLQSKTHAGFRSPLHEGGHVKVIATRGFSLGRPEGKGFNRKIEPQPMRVTALADKRYSKLNAYQAHERDVAREAKRQAEFEATIARGRKLRGGKA